MNFAGDTVVADEAFHALLSQSGKQGWEIAERRADNAKLRFENEMLRVRVYDWDFFSADDLIGQADVPLQGLLEYGQVEVELTLDMPDTTQKKVRGKHPKKTVPAGRLSGQILFEGRLPASSRAEAVATAARPEIVAARASIAAGDGRPPPWSACNRRSHA